MTFHCTCTETKALPASAFDVYLETICGLETLWRSNLVGYQRKVDVDVPVIH